MTLSVLDAAREAPDRLALVAGDTELSFAALAARVERRIAELHAQGALDPAGERPVAVVARPILSVVETLLALFAAGTPALLLHARLSEPEREALCRRAGAVLAAPSGEAGAGGLPSRFIPAPFDPERIAALVPTSGSTGEPRIVRLSHRAFLAAGRLIAERFGLEDDRWLLALPLAHIGGLGMLARAVMHRSTLVLFEPHRSMLGELDRLAAAVERHSITLLSLVPTLLARLLEPPLAWRPPPSIRMVLLGGAPIPRDLVARARHAGIPVVPTYGMTETCASAVLGRYAERLEAPGSGGEILASGSAGAGADFRLVEGVVELRGDTLFSGYLGEPASALEHGWLRTHDRGFLDERGDLVVTGRETDVIITGAENVDPAEVEAALMTLPGVQMACVFGVPDATFGEVVTALVVARPELPPSPATLGTALRGRLAPFKRPRRIELTRELPLTPAGKIDRRRARALYVARRM